ncbi:MAG: methylated-DNA--[protein]-cysteine S-methyltransferase [Helicobacteraceae bacterium]|nr:methylated-DNA--[protein]-cysteine S-methyltransferase [Helicobacteraceae bacterium]
MHNRNNVKALQNFSIFENTKMWLDIYFDNQIPPFTPPLKATGSSFALSVWEILLKIPYGKSSTYGAIAKIIATQRGLKKMSAQAVGGAVGANPIAIIIPCHRVIGSNGTLTGYAGGLDIKKKLLEIEGFKL